MIATLYREELKAMTRGRFAWLGAAVLLGVMTAFAAAATQDAWLDGFGIIAYTVVPLAFIPLTAGAIASPRANRFVESLFTSPIDRRQWLTAKVLVLLTMALGYYVALLPLALVFVAHVGVPFLLGRLLLYGLLLLPVSVAFGTLVGVLFIGKSVAPALATGVAVLLLFAGAVAYQEMTVVRGTAANFAARLAFISPAVLLKNALGFTLVAPLIPATAPLAAIAFAAVTVGALGLAAWVFLRLQGVETWETTPGKRAALAIGVLILLALPVALAETNYDTAAPAANAAPRVGGLFGRIPGNAVLVHSGGPAPANCCERLLNRRLDPLPTGMSSHLDLLLLLPTDAAHPLTSLAFHVEGAGGLVAVADPNAAAAPLQQVEAHDYAADAGPLAAGGNHVQRGWVLRIPVTLTPEHPWDLGGNRYPLNVTTTYQAEGAAPGNFTVHGAVEAQVPGALTQTAVVGAVAPAACLVAAVTRWKRTR